MIWYYALGGAVYGPVTLEDLRGLVEGRLVDPDTPVRPDGVDAWVPARAVSGLFPDPIAAAPSPRSAPAARSAIRPQAHAPAGDSQEPVGLGGWLALFAFGYVVQLFHLLTALLTSLGGADYDGAGASPLAALAFLAATAYAARAFFRRDRQWPNVAAVLAVVGAIAYPLVASDEGSGEEWLFIVAAAAVQLAYIQNSARVRRTFGGNATLLRMGPAAGPKSMEGAPPTAPGVDRAVEYVGELVRAGLRFGPPPPRDLRGGARPALLEGDARRAIRKPLLVTGALAALAVLGLVGAGLVERAKEQRARDEVLDMAYGMRALQPHDGLPPDNHPFSSEMGTEPMYDAIRTEQALERIRARQAARHSAEVAAAPAPPTVEVGWSKRQVVEALGTPDGLSAGGGPVQGMEWWYYHATRGRSWSRTITFTEEVVTAVGP